MAADIGSFSLTLAFILSLYSILISVLGDRLRKDDLVKSAQNAAKAVFGLLTLASLCLVYSFLAGDFKVEYVASHSNSTQSLPYVFAAFWAGHEGSLLMWEWFISLFAFMAIVLNRRKNRDLMPYVTAVIMGVVACFMFINIATSNPFDKLPFTPPDGQGMNPLLQYPAMAIHPPMVFLGYSGFTVPFAFAMAALITGNLGNAWIKTTRKWSIFSWFLLACGLLLGANWAYVVIGWGGYWGWDPVENSALMPWLLGTAFLHSVMIQEKKSMLKIWNMILIILTFTMCIFGTFLTRSGIVNSVHTFAESSIGYYFLAIIIAILAFAFALVAYRFPQLKSRNHLESFVSREMGFMVNNLILVGAFFAVFWGTIFPIISEAVKGVKITVGAPFFNQITLPIGIILLFLTGAGPLLAWRRTSVKNLKRHFLYPTVVALLAIPIFLALKITNWYALVSFTLCVFVTASIVSEFYRGVRARHISNNEPYAQALWNLVWKNRRRYGGYVVHIGIVLIFMSVAGNAFRTEITGQLLQTGDKMQLRNYTLQYDKFSTYEDPDKDVQSTTISVHKDGERIDVLHPRKYFFHSIRQDVQPQTAVAIRSTLKEDLYIVLAQLDPESGQAIFNAFINPLVMWLWIGGVVLILGTIITMYPEKEDIDPREKIRRDKTKVQITEKRKTKVSLVK